MTSRGFSPRLIIFIIAGDARFAELDLASLKDALVRDLQEPKVDLNALHKLVQAERHRGRSLAPEDFTPVRALLPTAAKPEPRPTPRKKVPNFKPPPRHAKRVQRRR